MYKNTAITLTDINSTVLCVKAFEMKMKMEKQSNISLN